MTTPGISSLDFFSAPRSNDAAHRVELTLAAARAFLATGFALIVHFFPPQGRPYPEAVPAIVASYLVYALLGLIVAGAQQRQGLAFRVGTQALDVVWPVFIPWLAWPYFPLMMVFELYAVMAAACRWSLWQTLATAGSNAVLVILEAGLINSGRLLTPVDEQFRLGLIVSRVVCLLMVAIVVGYLVEGEKKRWATSARSAEQLRLGRELHDGVIQSLVAAEIRLEVLRRQAAGSFPDVADEMADLQQILRREIVNIRQLIQQLSVTTLSSDQLPGELSRTVDKFQRETRISAEFQADSDKMALSSRVCFEIVRIVQEALANAMKHGRARRVLVQLASEPGFVKLLVEDDGEGFGFAGRLSQAELDTTSRAPKVIQERVRSIGGELAIESVPGRCARLEIRVPLQG